MEGRIKDPARPESEWGKMRHNHKSPDGSNIEVHFWENLATGAREGFKIKR